MADTFDPSKKATNAVLSNGNLTITTVPAAYSSALTVNPVSAGKLYAEFTVNNVGGSSNAIAFGVAKSTASLTNVPGGDANGVGIDLFTTPTFFFNNVSHTGGTFGTVANGIIIMIAVDFGLPDVWISGPSLHWNGDATASPATGVNGLRTLAYSTLNTLFPGPLYLMASTYNNSQGTLNVGTTVFSGSVPSGFTAWGSAGASAAQARALILA